MMPGSRYGSDFDLPHGRARRLISHDDMPSMWYFCLLYSRFIAAIGISDLDPLIGSLFSGI